MKMPLTVSQRHQQQAMEYAAKGMKAVGRSIAFLLVIILVQVLLSPPEFMYFMIVCGLIMAADAYSVIKHGAPLSSKRVITTCFGFIGFVLLLNYLYAFFGWLGIGATIIGTAIISIILAGILVWKNKEEFNAASDMLANMINERRGKQ